MSFQKYIFCGIFAVTITTGCEKTPNKTDTSNNFARAWCVSGGPIYTAKDDTPKIEAVAIRQGIITYAGIDAGNWCKDFAGGNSKIIDLNGAAAYPGFT